MTSDGALFVTGATDSSDFPVTASAYQSAYAGGPDREMPQFTHFGADRSVYLITNRDVSPRLPATAGVLKPSCSENPCGAAYAIRLDESLSRAIYATYLPGNTSVTQLHSDGSLYFAGSSEAGFPATPNAYQRESAGGRDAFVARLNATGTGILFGTYFGSPESDGIDIMAVARLTGASGPTSTHSFHAAVSIRPSFISMRPAQRRACCQV